MIACSQSAEPRKPVGREFRTFFDAERTSWVGKDARPLATTVWYPAVKEAEEREWNIGIFQAGSSALNAQMVTSPKTFPLIVLSHGTGGASMQLSWLAETLVANGYIVAAVNHHGNTAAEDAYLAQGFMLWWERARDLSAVIDQLLSDAQLGSRIDASKIGAAGFSLGGYTVLSVAGADTDLTQWKQFCAEQPDHPNCRLPPEVNFSQAELDALVKNDPIVKDSIKRSNESYRDSRIRSVYAIAPVLGIALTKNSLQNISIPVRIIVGSKDEQAAPEYNAALVASLIPEAELELLQDVSHYTFLARCNAKGKLHVPELCSDHEGIDRAQVHSNVGADVLAYFNKSLNIKSVTD